MQGMYAEYEMEMERRNGAISYAPDGTLVMPLVIGLGTGGEASAFRMGSGLSKIMSYPMSNIDNYYASDAREAIKKLFNN